VRYVGAHQVAALQEEGRYTCVQGLRLQGFFAKLLWNRCHIAEETMPCARLL
jgi:hypothetical protein